MYKILLVEDDAGIAKEIADYAAGWGLEVHIAKNFENIMAEFAVDLYLKLTRDLRGKLIHPRGQ